MTKNTRFHVLPNFFRNLIASAIQCSDGVEYRTLVEVVVNLRSGTFEFSSEVSDYLYWYPEEGLEQCLRLKCAEHYERSRVSEWLRACYELEWEGFGSDICLDELAEAPSLYS